MEPEGQEAAKRRKPLEVLRPERFQALELSRGRDVLNAVGLSYRLNTYPASSSSQR